MSTKTRPEKVTSHCRCEIITVYFSKTANLSCVNSYFEKFALNMRELEALFKEIFKREIRANVKDFFQYFKNK